jgi:hypothetical protein
VKWWLTDMRRYIDRFCSSAEEIPTMIEQEIDEFVLSDIQHMRVAQSVYKAWPGIRLKLIRAFLTQLLSVTRRELDVTGSWIVETGDDVGDDLLAADSVLVQVRRRQWPPGWAVGLSPTQKNLHRVYLGLWCEPKSAASKAECDRLFALLKVEPYRLGQSDDNADGWYPAFEYLPQLGFSPEDFWGEDFFEMARAIYRREPSANTLVSDLAKRLTAVSLEADKVLGRPYPRQSN